MNSREMVEAVAKKLDTTQVAAGRAITAVFDTIREGLVAGGETRITGFGTFSTLKREATTGRNPRTGEKIDISAKTLPKFKAARFLHDTLN